MIDCFDAQVVSWSIGASPDAELVNKMLDAVIETLCGNSLNRGIQVDTARAAAQL